MSDKQNDKRMNNKAVSEGHRHNWVLTECLAYMATQIDKNTKQVYLYDFMKWALERYKPETARENF